MAIHFSGLSLKLSEAIRSSDSNLRQMAVGMVDKFDKYWGDYSHILSFGAILDPHLKLSFVQARYRKLHDDGKLVELRNQFEKMFKTYANKTSRVNNQMRREDSSTRGMQEFDEDNFSDCSSFGYEDLDIERIEFELYLAEPRIRQDFDFDVLAYWKENQMRYLALAAMARNILSIPITTVASESSFSIEGRILNKWQTRLLPENAEAVITTCS